MMKKTKMFLMLSLTVTLSTNLFLGCSNKNTKETLKNNEVVTNFDSIDKHIDNNESLPLNISVDSRMEILSVVEYLADYSKKDNMIYSGDSTYKKDIDEFFKDYKEHSVVSYFEELSNYGFSYDAPSNLMIYLSNDLKERKDSTPIDDDVILRAGGKENIDKFLELLRDFKEESNFDTFFNEHENYYSKLTSKIKEKLESTNCMDNLKNFYGTNQNSYNIIIVPLNAGGYGIRIPQENDKYDVYSVICPINDEKYLSSFVWHEFSHSYVNPLTEEYLSKVSKYENLFKPICDKMNNQAYGKWEICVNEHIVRAVTSKLSSKVFGDGVGNSELRKHKLKSFFYIDALYERLEEYENNRDKYKTFADFYPRLIDVFKELFEQDLGDDFYKLDFIGPLNSVYLNKEPNVFIVPTNEDNKETEKQIKEYVTEIRDILNKDSNIISDKEALEQDLSDKNIYVYGTPNGNLWLKKHIDKLPVTIDSNKIIAEKTYEGTNLRYITAWPNFENKEKGIAIYTAQNAKDIIGICNVYHGPTDYVIADKEALNSGDYYKEGAKWSFQK